MDEGGCDEYSGAEVSGEKEGVVRDGEIWESSDLEEVIDISIEHHFVQQGDPRSVHTIKGNEHAKVLKARMRKSANTCSPVLYPLDFPPEPHSGRSPSSCRRVISACSKCKGTSANASVHVSGRSRGQKVEVHTAECAVLGHDWEVMRSRDVSDVSATFSSYSHLELHDMCVFVQVGRTSSFLERAAMVRAEE